MHYFYTPDVAERAELPAEESLHCNRVLRLGAGDKITCIDGKGKHYDATITVPHAKHCGVTIEACHTIDKGWIPCIEIAVAPTKNIDRTEWFAEKATEIGIDVIQLLRCRYSERKEIKKERIEKIVVSAMKQSIKSYLPQVVEIEDFKKYITTPFSGQKFIAHCYDTPRTLLKQAYHSGENVRILIGPEGDFSEEEVALAIANGYLPITLGNSRLRTETAALVACHTIHLLL